MLMKTVFHNCERVKTKHLINSLIDNPGSLLILRHASVKHSITIDPGLEKLLDSKEIKHRNHPGVRKVPPKQLPPNLINAAYKLICNSQSEKLIMKTADELIKFISLRRLPIEQEEMDARLKRILHSDDHPNNLPETPAKEKLRIAQKQISSEIKRWKPIEFDEIQSLAYLAKRLAANYASISKVFTEINTKLPQFQPKTFFDFGSGVGSAVWSANEMWGHSIHEYFCVDSSPDMIDIAQKLTTDEDTGECSIKNVNYRQFLPASENIKYDVVVSAFSLLDLPSVSERLRVIDTLWRKTNDILVIIEYGNLSGYYSVMDARDYILHIENNSSRKFKRNSTGAHLLLPCPHSFQCPLLAQDHKKVCGTHVLYEDIFPRHRNICKRDWISYVVFKKGHKLKDENSWPRIIQPVMRKSRRAICRMCCNDGKFKELTITKNKNRHAYRCAASSSMGDFLPFNIEELDTEEVLDLQEDTSENEK
ncbi:methyltransferase-like protein 17, mitochondrial [Caerostris darwini]|uniref:Methyltransferase-like protein 17, mitochondrial n=1 Tax=Caerostris darwini TaxID=1538125 RepID=A0AAV4S2R0_9ARAC|nr:methyltransferase-like protein 17, mitochondrial [Caerostris darwini]